ncbi:hypothetical protein QAD02_007105 [Eretmocerus hayati]|uniref:Uncharacterized protein n=1 Tax=Eretmocerus hayati TaxID=131215 RepID=A0ACC2N391_9HYME|nr:hypothetical protein QAD02_007105 [Eretmocerus hayati]
MRWKKEPELEQLKFRKPMICHETRQAEFVDKKTSKRNEPMDIDPIEAGEMESDDFSDGDIDSESAKKTISELPISGKLTQLAAIDVNDTLSNQFLNKSKGYREAIGIVSHPQRIAQIATELISIEYEINKTLYSQHLDAKLRGPNCPQPREPIRRDSGRSIFGTWRDRKSHTPALPSISEELSTLIEPIQLNPARQNIIKASKFDFPPRFSDKADSEDEHTGTKHTKSAGVKAIGLTSTHLNEHNLLDPTVAHHDLSPIGEQNQPQLLTKTISHLSGNQNLKEKRASEYF